MKKVLCPKCDNDITFNEDRYEKNVSLFFVCPYCGKQFNVSVADLTDKRFLIAVLLSYWKIHTDTVKNFLFLWEII